MFKMTVSKQKLKAEKGDVLEKWKGLENESILCLVRGQRSESCTDGKMRSNWKNKTLQLY